MIPQVVIVVVEDDPAVNESLVLSLEKAGFQVQTFFTVEAFEKEALAPADVYLLDRQLGGTDGLDLCRRLKSKPLTQNIPVVIMSASPEAAQYMHEAGGDMFLEKPFTRKQLLDTLAKVLKS